MFGGLNLCIIFFCMSFFVCRLFSMQVVYFTDNKNLRSKRFIIAYSPNI